MNPDNRKLRCAFVDFGDRDNTFFAIDDSGPKCLGLAYTYGFEPQPAWRKVKVVCTACLRKTQIGCAGEQECKAKCPENQHSAAKLGAFHGC
jgi:hypothetical protein